MSTQPYLPDDERRQITIRAVVDLAAEHDPARITTGAIAESMRVTQGALSRHFPSKEASLAVVVTWVTGGVMQRVEAAAPGTWYVLPTASAMFLVHIRFVAQHPGVPRLLVGQLQQHEPTPARSLVHGRLRRYHQRVKSLLREGHCCGETAAELDREATATPYVDTMQGLLMQSLVVGVLAGIRKGTKAVLAIHRGGIRAGAGARS